MIQNSYYSNDYFYYTGNGIKFLDKVKSKFGIIVIYVYWFNQTPERSTVSYYDVRKKKEVFKTKDTKSGIQVKYYYYNSKKSMIPLNFLKKYESSISFNDFHMNFSKLDDVNLKQLERNIKINRLGLV